MSDSIERFENRPTDFVGVAGPTVVYVGIADRTAFDNLILPVRDSGENEDGHVLSKVAGNYGRNEVTVIFQHWIKSKTVAAIIADAEAKRAATTAERARA